MAPQQRNRASSSNSSKKPAKATAAAADADADSAPPTKRQWARFLLLQHGGLLLAVAAVLLIVLGYEDEWLRARMHPTTLCLASVALAGAGLLMHETRPVRVREVNVDESTLTSVRLTGAVGDGG